MRVLPLLLALVLAGAVSTGLPLQDETTMEDQCEAEWRAFWSDYGRHYDTPEARTELLEVLAPLIERYRDRAPKCEGLMRRHEAYLLVVDRHFREVIKRTDEFLQRVGERTSPSVRAQLRLQRGYTFEEIGEELAAAQEYLAGAALAHQVPADIGGRALLRASMINRDLGDYDMAQQYLDEGLALLTDSLKAKPRLREDLGRALITQCFQIDSQLALTSDPEERRELVEGLAATSERAVDLLAESKEQWSLGYRAQGMAFYALAAAYVGHYEEARRRIAPAAALAELAGITHPRALPEIWLAQSRIAELGGDHEAAREAALQLRGVARQHAMSEYEAIAYERIGVIAEAEGHWAEAEAAYSRAIDYRETVRERLGLQDWNTRAFATMQAPYRGLIRTRLAEGDVEGALQTLDQTQARYLRDLSRHLAVRSRLSPQQRTAADSVVHELEDVRLAILNEELNGAERAARMQRASELQEDLESLTGAHLPPAPQLDLPRLQQVLAAQHRTLIAYLLDDQASTAFIVRPDTVLAVPLDVTPSDVRDQLRALGSPWREGAPSDPAFAIGPLYHLYETVFAPLEPWLEEAEALTVIPDGILGAVPFSMLLTEPSETYEDASYLIRRLPITTELASSLVGRDAEPTQGSAELDLVAYGRSQFDGATPSPYEKSLADLPYVDRELRRLSRWIKQSRVVLGEDATEARFKRDLPTAQVVHVATHAEAHPTLPLYSRIYLSDDPEEDDDGILYLYEIQNQSLPAELVVLSGCSTARGVSHAGEGIIGLQYAVRAAGAHASLATLWPIDDSSIVDLMDHFYKGLSEGLPKDEALRRAQLAYLDSHHGLQASPFFWASPILSGTPSPVPIQSGWSLRWVIALLVGGLGAGLAWHLYIRRPHA